MITAQIGMPTEEDTQNNFPCVLKHEKDIQIFISFKIQ